MTASWTLGMWLEKIESFWGRIEERHPAAIVVAFGTQPVEDAPTRAVLAAMAIRKAAGQAQVGRTQGIVAAIHVDAVRIGRDRDGVQVHQDDLHDTGVVLQALVTAGQTRLGSALTEQVGGPGITLMTGEAARFVEGLVDVVSLGPLHITGRVKLVEVYDVRGSRPARSRFQTRAAPGLVRFVGRDAELEQLRRAMRHAGQGHGQIVAVMGEPGVGKSRLVWEFTHSQRTPDWLIFETRSVSYGKP